MCKSRLAGGRRPQRFAELMGPILSWFLVALAPGADAAPKAPVPAKSAELVLVKLSVNDAPRLVQRGETLIVVRGDMLVIRAAEIRNAAPGTATSINLVGYSPKSPTATATGPESGAALPPGTDAVPPASGTAANWGDDRGHRIDTQSGLESRFAMATEPRETFPLRVSVRGRVIGEVFIRVVPATVAFVELSVNGERKVLRTGDSGPPFELGTDDMMKVERIETNVSPRSEVLVRVQVASRTTSNAATESGARPVNRNNYELHFSRRGHTIARIPLHIVSGRTGPAAAATSSSAASAAPGARL